MQDQTKPMPTRPTWRVSDNAAQWGMHIHPRRTLHPMPTLVVVLSGVAAFCPALSLGQGVPPLPIAGKSQLTLAGQIDLPRLVDLSAQRLGLNIQYDAASLRGSVTLRLGAGISDDELWALTNRVLASQGFTTVRMHEGGAVTYSVVRLADAPGLARFGVEGAGGARDDEALAEQGPPPGYATLVLRARHRPAKDLLEAVRPVLSKSGSVATELGSSGLILLADLAPRLEEAQRVLEMLDAPAAAPVIEEVPARHLSPTALAAAAMSLAAKREQVSGQRLPGEVTPAPGGSAVLLVAPAESAAAWRSLLAQLDRREEVVTRSYTPRAFAPSEVAGLIEQTVRPGVGAAGSADDRFRIVQDDLTGTLIITATAAQHEEILALLTRLESAAPETRRPVRAFVIRNRSVIELLTVLQGMLGAGVLDAAAASEGGLLPASPTLTAPDIGRTDRPLDPRGGPPVSTSGQPSPAASGDTYPLLARSSSPTAVIPRGGAAPDLILTADEATSTIVAIGEARQLAQLEALIKQLDVRQPQVMLEVLLVSLSEAQSLALGVELQKELNLAGDTRATLASLFGLASRTADGVPGFGAGAGFTGLVLSPGDFSIVVRALETLNNGRSMSMPKVLVGNNQQGTFTSVLQQPFASLSTGTATTTTSFGGTLDAGTIATVRPQIAAGDHLLLDFSVQLSSFVGASVGDGLPPPKQTNSVQSQVTIPDGHTVVVGGLELLTETDTESRVPLIGGIPLVGELFRNRTRNYGRDRFFVFIRANILRHGGFEDLRHLSAGDLGVAGVDDGWPVSRPRVVR